MENKPTLNTSQQLTTASRIKLCGDKDSGITQAIQYVIALLGTPKDKQPSQLEMQLIINWLKTYRSKMPVDEIRTAYDLTLSGTLRIDLNTFGGTLSLKNIMSVLNEYKAYKTNLLKKEIKEEPMINIDRAGAVFNILKSKPEVIETLKEIGAQKPYVYPETNKHPLYDTHQRWIKQFDWIYKYFPVTKTGRKFIKRSGKIMDMDEFFNYKADQLYRVKEYLKLRN